MTGSTFMVLLPKCVEKGTLERQPPTRPIQSPECFFNRKWEVVMFVSTNVCCPWEETKETEGESLGTNFKCLTLGKNICWFTWKTTGAAGCWFYPGSLKTWCFLIFRSADCMSREALIKETRTVGQTSEADREQKFSQLLGPFFCQWIID